MKIYILFIILFSPYSLCLYNRQHDTLYHKDMIGQSDRNKLLLLAEELVIDSRLKQRQLHAIKAQFTYRLPYETGLIIGKIREKYKRMNDIFKEVTDRHRKRNILTGPGSWRNTTLYYVMAMETVKAIEMEIDKMVQVLETVPRIAFDREFELLRDFMGGDKLGLTRPTPHPNMTISTAAWPGDPAYMEELPYQAHGRQGAERPEHQEINLPRPAATRILPLTEQPISRSFKNEMELKAYYRDKYDENNGRNKDDKWFDRFYGFS